MTVFDYHDYKQCVNGWISEQKSGGHGQLRKLSNYLGINSVVMSQVFRGGRDLTLEQALGVTEFMGLSEAECDYFLLLVQKSRAGSHKLKQVFEKQMKNLQESSKSLKNRIKHQKFSDEGKATFYSHWYYSAVRLGVSIPELNTVAKIADYLGLDRRLVANVVSFLLQNQLLVETKNGFSMGPQVTHVGHDSPFVGRHRNNWRVQGLRAQERNSNEQLFYSGPMALSVDAADKIRKLLVELIEKSTQLAAKSDSETLRCLNIDWFEIKG